MTVVVCLVLASTGLDAADAEQDRREDAGLVIEEILAIDDNIPQDLLDTRPYVAGAPPTPTKIRGDSIAVSRWS